MPVLRCKLCGTAVDTRYGWRCLDCGPPPRSSSVPAAPSRGRSAAMWMLATPVLMALVVAVIAMAATR